MKYVVRTFNPEQSVIKETNKDFKVGAIYKQDNIIQCNVYSTHGLFIDMLEITMQ